VSFNPQQVSAATESGVNPKNTPLLEANWLELWYQPKIDSQMLCPNGAEALLRMRHPQLGIVLPASFIPDEDGDLGFQALSQFVIDQAIADWHSLFAEQRRVDISINSPISFLHDPAAWIIFIGGCRITVPWTALSSNDAARRLAVDHSERRVRN
jgi:EAL domain-containing protein (putative c-di-GMP-specific phosphodiesterase class I)